MTEKINVRQICFTFTAFTTVVKLLVMPAVTAGFAKESFWISAALNFLADGMVLLFVLHLNDKYGGKSLYEIISVNVGDKTAKTVYLFYGIFFFVKAYVPLIEQKNYIETSLYQTVSGLSIFILFFVFSSFFSYKSIRAIGRCADISIWLTIFAYVILISLAVPSAKFSELLPVIGVKPSEIGVGALKSAMWYADSSYLLFMLGHFKKEKHYKKKIILSFVAAAIAVIFFIMVLYAEFGPLTVRQFFAPIRMGKYSVALANIGRIDYIANFAYIISSVYATAIPLLFSTYCILKVFPIKHRIFAAIGVNALMAIIMITTENVYFYTFGFIQNYLIWFILFMAYVLPFLTVFFNKGRVSK